MQRRCKAVNALSEQYAEAGYGHGMRVALMLDNRAEFFLHFLALNKLGISIVPVNSSFLPREIAYVITHSDALPGFVSALLSGQDAGGPCR